MADIELVIKVPEELYEAYKGRPPMLGDAGMDMIAQSIANGTPLPKGHGDLIDVNRKITISTYDEQYEEWGEKTLTVLEALNKWSDEGVRVEDVIIPADKGGENEQIR